MRTKYTVHLSPNAGLNPPIVTYFKTISEGSYSYNYYQLRHPGGIYNLTTTRLISGIETLVVKLNEDNSETDIYNYLRIVLYDLFKFYDACYEIMQCFTNQHTPPDGFVHTWLKKNGYTVGEQFYSGIKNDDDFIYLRDLYNALKHTGNEVRYLKINNGQESIWGYWLQMGDGASGLAAKQSTVTSINSELRRIQYLIYKISANLQDALVDHMKDVYGVDWLPDTQALPDGQFVLLHNLVSALPELFFYNEIDSTFWKSKYTGTGNPSLVFDPITIDKATQDANFYVGRPIHGTQTDSGDGFTRKFSFPHLGLQAP